MSGFGIRFAAFYATSNAPSCRIMMVGGDIFRIWTRANMKLIQPPF